MASAAVVLRSVIGSLAENDKCVLRDCAAFYKNARQAKFCWRAQSMASKSIGKVAATILLSGTAFVASDIVAGRITNSMYPVQSRTENIAAEREYRISVSPYNHGLRPSTTAESSWANLHFTLFTNSLGFKDQAVRDVPLTSDSRRILFIGDSFTEGVGVAYEQTFVGRIGAELSSVADVEVFNAGVVSYSPSIYYSKIRHLLEEVGLEIDDVVVFIDISDMHDDGVRYRLLDDASVSSTAPPAEGDPSFLETLKARLKQNSVTARLLDVMKDGLTEADWSTADLDTPWLHTLVTSPRSAWSYDDGLWNEYGSAGQRAASVAMTKLASLLAERNVSLTIVIYPWPTQILIPEGSERHIGYWQDWAMKHDAGFVNLFPDFLTAGDARQVLQTFFLPRDVHWNADGHEFVAERFLAQSNLTQAIQSELGEKTPVIRVVAAPAATQLPPSVAT
jgi:hypothetical protein